MTDRYEKLKREVLPKSVLEHFDQVREVFENNKKVLKGLGEPVDSASEGDNALLKISMELFKRTEHSLDILFSDMELAYVSSSLLRKKIKNIEDALQQQGIKLKNIEEDEAFEWIKSYFKHASETTND